MAGEESEGSSFEMQAVFCQYLQVFKSDCFVLLSDGSFASLYHCMVEMLLVCGMQ